MNWPGDYINQVVCGDALEVLKSMPDEVIQTCVTSPPYWGLRDYGVEGQLGLEKSPVEYVTKMVEVFEEVRRVLRPDGTLWLNLGDSYAGSWGNYGGQNRGNGSQRDIIKGSSAPSAQGNYLPPTHRVQGTKPKDLVGIPWMVAFALRDAGWYLRSDVIEEVELYCPCGCGYVLEERIWRHSQDREIIWNKPNPMPESVKDRPTKAHEYLFLMSKSRKYYYDHEAIREPIKDVRNYKTPDGWDTSKGDGGHGSYHKNGREQGQVRVHGNKPGRGDNG